MPQALYQVVGNPGVQGPGLDRVLWYITCNTAGLGYFSYKIQVVPKNKKRGNKETRPKIKNFGKKKFLELLKKEKKYIKKVSFFFWDTLYVSQKTKTLFFHTPPLWTLTEYTGLTAGGGHDRRLPHSGVQGGGARGHRGPRSGCPGMNCEAAWH